MRGFSNNAVINANRLRILRICDTISARGENVEKEFACFFTGHRIIANSKIAAIEERIEREAETLINDKGVTDFITGGARGFDTIAARVIIRLKKKYDYIKLHLYLPCYDQMEKWSARDRYTARMIMSYADSKLYAVEGNYVAGCMQLRNKKMANDAEYCIAYMNNPRSGTASTVSYARDIGDTVINIGYEE